MSNSIALPLRIAILCAMLLGVLTSWTPSTFAKDGSAEEKVSETDESPRDTTHELAAPLQDYPIYPEDRPMWVDQPDNVGDDWAELVVLSIPSLSNEKSLESLAQQQQIALSAYAEQYIGVAGAGDLLTFTAEQIETELVDPQRTYDGKLTTSTGEMHQHASVLVLDNNFHTQIVQQWKTQEVAERLKAMGVIGALALVALAGVTGLLKSISPRSKPPQDETAVMA